MFKRILLTVFIFTLGFGIAWAYTSYSDEEQKMWSKVEIRRLVREELLVIKRQELMQTENNLRRDHE